MLRDQESTGSRSLLRAERPSEAPSFGSQPCHVSSGEDTQPASQAQFATQAPLTKRPAAGASRLGASSEAQNVSSIMDREAARSSDILARSIANNSKIEEWTKSSTTTNHSLREQAKSHAPALNGNKGSVNQAAALLILLAQQGKAPVPKAVSNGLPKIHPTASVAAIKCKLATAREVASTQDSGPDVGDPTRQLVRPEMEICTQPTAKVTTEPSVNVVSKMPAKRKSQSPIQDGARERISKRDVRIAKDQEALLNSEDCK